MSEYETLTPWPLAMTACPGCEGPLWAYLWDEGNTRRLTLELVCRTCGLIVPCFLPRPKERRAL